MWLLNKLVKQVLRMRWLSRPRSEVLDIPGSLDGSLCGASLLRCGLVDLQRIYVGEAGRLLEESHFVILQGTSRCFCFVHLGEPEAPTVTLRLLVTTLLASDRHQWLGPRGAVGLGNVTKPTRNDFRMTVGKLFTGIRRSSGLVGPIRRILRLIWTLRDTTLLRWA